MGRHRSQRADSYRRAKRDPPEADERLSKKLSSILRHRLAENGLSSVLRPDGYVPLEALLATPGFRGTSVEEIRSVVKLNDKQRFSIIIEDDGNEYIRANQGHTSAGVDETALLERLDNGALHELDGRAVHGTFRAAWDGIVASGGLSPMARHHVHLAADLPGRSGVISGMRGCAELQVWIDLHGAARAGVPFFRSANGVILTPGLPKTGLLPIEHFERVVDSARGLAWRDGAWRDLVAS
jgi:2'-phosphotransferase